MSRINGFSKLSTNLWHVLPVLTLLILSVTPAMAKKQGSGDFNGDGYADLCIGVPNYTSGTITNAGAVNCIYGSAWGLQATGMPLAAQLWTRDESPYRRQLRMVPRGR